MVPPDSYATEKQKALIRKLMPGFNARRLERMSKNKAIALIGKRLGKSHPKRLHSTDPLQTRACKKYGVSAAVRSYRRPAPAISTCPEDAPPGDSRTLCK